LVERAVNVANGNDALSRLDVTRKCRCLATGLRRRSGSGDGQRQQRSERKPAYRTSAPDGGRGHDNDDIV
jgi:hypothetical protein